jgi:hypothetical protein
MIGFRGAFVIMPLPAAFDGSVGALLYAFHFPV